MADFSALKASTLDRAGLPSTDGMAQDQTLGRAVNAAIQQLSGWRSWPWLYTEATASTVAGSTVVTLPVAATHVHFVALGSDVLDRRQRGDLFRFQDGGQGRPTRWSSHDMNSVSVACTPDDAYVLTFGLTKVEPGLTGSSDTPLLPVQFHDLLAVLAARYLAVRKRDTELTRLLDAEVSEWRKSLDRAALLAVGTMPIRTRQDWSI